MPRSPYWIAIAFFAALVLAKFDPTTGFNSLIRFGETWSERRLPVLQGYSIATAPDSAGYDGQFYAQIAIDPALRDPALGTALDAPSYRARRILAPLIAFLAGLGQPGVILQLYALLNVGCWLGLAWLLYREIGHADLIAFARWTACLFSLGALDSVRQSLVDLPALLLLVCAVRASSSANPLPVSWLSLGHLTKETHFLASVALAAWPRPDARRVLGLAVSALPLGLWMIYVSAQLPSSPNQSGLGNFTWPLFGMFQQIGASVTELFSGNFDSRHVFGLLGISGLILQAGVLWCQRDTTNAWWRIGAAYSILFLFFGPWIWSGYWAAFRAVLPLTIAFNLLLPATRTFWPFWIFGNLTILHAVWRFL